MREFNQLSNGKIYRIVCGETKKVYIGSTCEATLESRLKSHEVSYKRYKKYGIGHCSSYEILENNNYKIELIQLYPCESRQDLCVKEGECQLLYRCINKNMAGRNSKEYYQDNKKKLLENVKKYQLKNKEKIKQKSNTIVECDVCQCKYKYASTWMHKQSKKHLRNKERF